VDNQGLTFEQRVSTIQAAYAALNRGDAAGFVASFDPHVERIESAERPMTGTFHGIDAVTEHVVNGRGNWAEGTCEPERFIDAGDRVIAIAKVHVRLKHEAEWRDGRVGDVFTFRNGKVIQFRTFFDVRQALEWAGLTTSAEDTKSLPRLG
jgi:ketosteroid isomerase-like protein